MILSDLQIRELCTGTERPMIEPYLPNLVNKVDDKKVISFGQSSHGYDITLVNEFKVFRPRPGDPVTLKDKDYGVENTLINYKDSRNAIDPTLPHEDAYRVVTLDDPDKGLIMMPGDFVTSMTEQYFRMPRDVLAICMGKSTYARVGINVIVTPLEPEWEGNLVVEIVNLNPNPVIIRPHHGIAQLLFLKGEPCETSYRDRGGKYQGQNSIVDAKV